MTTILQANFVAAAGTVVTSLTPAVGGPWTGFTGFANGPVVSDANRLRTNANDSNYYVGAAEGDTASVTFRKLGTSVCAVGAVVRADPASTNCYLAWYNTGSTGNITLMRFDGVGPTVVTLADVAGQNAGISTGSDHTIKLVASGTGATVNLEVFVNGVSKLTYADNHANRRVTGRTGFQISGETTNTTGLHLIGVLGEAVSASASIGISTPVGGKIHQRSGTAGTISVSGTYTGTPTTIEARLVLDGTNTPVSGYDWSVKDAAPSGSAYSFSFAAVPQGGWYNVQVRHSNDTAVNSTSGKVGIGALFVVDGQSNAWLWFSSTAYAGDSSLTPNPLLRIAGIQPTSWDVPATATMNASIACGNALVSALGIPVGLIDGTWDGSGLTISSNGGQWIIGGAAGNAYTSSAAAISAETTAIEGNVWIQGESDAGSATQSAYYTALGQMIALRRTALSQPALPYVIATLARDTSGTSTDTKRQNINLALAQKCGDANIYRVDRYDLPLHTDGIHHTAAGFTALGQRVARALLAAIGKVSTYRGPRIASVSKVNSTTFDINLTHDYGSDFTPTSSITGLRVTDGGTPVTVSSAVQQAANKVRIVLASAPSALPVVQVAYGMAPNVSGVLKDNSALTLPLEFNGGVTAVAADGTVFVKVSGVYKQADSVHVKVGGVYKQADEIHMKQASVYAPL